MCRFTSGGSRLAARHTDWALAFPEINVRTYVTAEEKPGVWFFSLDAASLGAVVSARMAFHLPYFWARMQMNLDSDGVAFASRRRRAGAGGVDFAGRYRPTGPVFQSAPGSLEDWLTARYCLYAADRTSRVYRAEIHHPPWPLQTAEAEIALNTMTVPQTIPLRGEPLLHFARQIDVLTWLPTKVTDDA